MQPKKECEQCGKRAVAKIWNEDIPEYEYVCKEHLEQFEEYLERQSEFADAESDF